MTGIYLSAAHKSSGKTTLAIGLCAALAARGRRVQPFKKGPDYIDPMWLALAAGRPCHNLDFQTQTPDDLRDLYARLAARADLALVEGNKGLHDGLDLDGSNSNAALAKLLGLPVVLVIDASGSTRGVAPLLLGYQAFDPAVRIGGVIFNKVGGARHAAKLRAVTEHYTNIPVLGCVQRSRELVITERHLGLIPSNESAAAQALVTRLSEHAAAQVDLDAIERIAHTADRRAPPAPATARPMAAPVRIAIARDRAFGFYYAGDLEAFAEHGATLVPFDTLHDPRLPDVDGLFIGGGFPETAMEELAANAALRADLRERIESGLPTYAECGGLMYLARRIRWGERVAAMVGAIPADVEMTPRPLGKGYVTLQATDALPWRPAGAATDIRAHEFHYSRLVDLDAVTFGYRVTRGTGIDGTHDGIVRHRLLASYTHLRHTPATPWVRHFVDYVRAHANRGAPR